MTVLTEAALLLGQKLRARHDAELIAMLRELAEEIAPDFGLSKEATWQWDAADRLESLAAEVERLKTERDEAKARAESPQCHGFMEKREDGFHFVAACTRYKQEMDAAYERAAIECERQITPFPNAIARARNEARGDCARAIRGLAIDAARAGHEYKS